MDDVSRPLNRSLCQCVSNRSPAPRHLNSYRLARRLAGYVETSIKWISLLVRGCEDMKGRYVSIGAVVLAVLLVNLFPSGLLHVLFGRGTALFWGQPYVEYFLIYFVLPGGICLEIVAFVRRRRTTEKDSSPEPVRERIVTERVLVMCPFCSTKVEQGVSFCPNCGGKM